ncbi:lipoprotein 17-related variable surface protein [Mycoplasma sp. CB776]
MSKKVKIILSAIATTAVAAGTTAVAGYYFFKKNDTPTSIQPTEATSNNQTNLDKEPKVNENGSIQKKKKEEIETKTETNVKPKEVETEKSVSPSKENPPTTVENKKEEPIVESGDQEFENAPQLEVNIDNSTLRFSEIHKENFSINNSNNNLSYSVESFRLNDDQRSISVVVKIIKADKSKTYTIDNFTDFKTEEQYYIELLNSKTEALQVHLIAGNENKKANEYTINNFELNNQDNNFTYELTSLSTVQSNQETGIRTTVVSGTISKDNHSQSFNKTVTWNFETDREVLARVIKNKQVYQAEIDKILNKKLIPAEISLSSEKIQYYDSKEDVYFIFNRAEELNDFEGTARLQFEVRKNDSAASLSLTFNGFNKIVAEDKDYNNTHRSATWNINAPESDSTSYKKEYVFTRVGLGGKIGRNYWYVNSDKSKDIVFEITKKNNKPIYVYNLELIFMHYGGYYNDNDFYHIEYKTTPDGQWQKADMSTNVKWDQVHNAIPHIHNKIDIKKDVVAIRVVFEKGKQPTYYTHISSLMPYIKQYQYEQENITNTDDNISTTNQENPPVTTNSDSEPAVNQPVTPVQEEPTVEQPTTLNDNEQPSVSSEPSSNDSSKVVNTDDSIQEPTTTSSTDSNDKTDTTTVSQPTENEPATVTENPSNNSDNTTTDNEPVSNNSSEPVEPAVSTSNEEQPVVSEPNGNTASEPTTEEPVVSEPVDEEFENAPHLDVSINNSTLRFSKIQKENFSINNTNNNLSYSVESFSINEDQRSISIVVKITKEEKSKTYIIDNFTNFKTEEQYYDELLTEKVQNLALVIKPESKNKKLNEYVIEDFAVNIPDSQYQYNLSSFSAVSENQETGIRTTTISGTISKDNHSKPFATELSWSFETDKQIVARVIANKQKYQAEIDKLFNKNLIPSEIQLNPQVLQYHDQKDDVQFTVVNKAQSLKDFEGSATLQFRVTKNNASDTVSLTFNGFNKIVAEDKDYNNRHRSATWNISAPQPSSSWKKEYVFIPVGSWGYLGKNYWYTNANPKQDIHFEITKKNNQPIYVYNLELIFIRDGSYYKDQTFYHIEYKTANNNNWQRANMNTIVKKNQWHHGVQHVHNTIDIKKEVTAIRVVFEKGKQPKYVHISSLMPYVKER